MKPCTSINVFFDSTFTVPVETQIQRVYDAGFRHMDMNFWDWCHDPASPFRQDNWRDWVEGAARKAQSLNVKFTQAHADVFNFYKDGMDGNGRYEMYRRSIEGAAMLGIPWVTYHPSRVLMDAYESPEAEKKNLDDNIEHYKPLVELAEKFKVGIAIENMSTLIGKAWQLNYIVDGLKSDYVGICWDTGHAHIKGEDQAASIREMGSRLHALHVQDNDGVRDEHLAPHYGTIDWTSLMNALREINYPGDFTFEAHMLVRKLPEPCRADALRLMYTIGEELVGDNY